MARWNSGCGLSFFWLPPETHALITGRFKLLTKKSGEVEFSEWVARLSCCLTEFRIWLWCLYHDIYRIPGNPVPTFRIFSSSEMWSTSKRLSVSLSRLRFLLSCIRYSRVFVVLPICGVPENPRKSPHIWNSLKLWLELFLGPDVVGSFLKSPLTLKLVANWLLEPLQLLKVLGLPVFLVNNKRVYSFVPALEWNFWRRLSVHLQLVGLPGTFKLLPVTLCTVLLPTPARNLCLISYQRVPENSPW